MRGLVYALCVVGSLGVLLATSVLLDPVPPRSDAPAFALLAGSALLVLIGAALLRRRAWQAWVAAAWLGASIAAIVLAYKDSFREELAHFGPWTLAGHVLLHALIAPITVFFGFAIGFVEPDAWMYVLACVAVALLGTELVRRRLWPRERRARSGAPHDS